MSKKSIEILLERYQQGECNTEEREMVDRWFAAHGEEHSAVSQMSPVARDALIKELYLDIQLSNSSAWQHINHLWRRIAIAASIILVMGIGGYFVLHQRTATVAKTIDLIPGSNKATLTLANGKKIALTQGTFGKLAMQGNTLVQMQEGNIVYTGNSTAVTTFNTLTTIRGEQFSLVLADGTRVWLNAASSITYPVTFSGHSREVTVTGEAYFEVAHNAAMPFRVKTNDAMVQVLGTHFNVNAYPGEGSTKIALLQGSVQVEQPVTHEKKKIVPGEQASVGKGGAINVGKVDLARVIAWKQGLFDFNGMDLPEVMRQVSRWYNVDVDYPEGVPDIRFTGQIHRDVNASQVLDILSYFGVRFHIVQQGAVRKIMVQP